MWRLGAGLLSKSEKNIGTGEWRTDHLFEVADLSSSTHL